MDLNNTASGYTDRELEHYADIIRRSGKFHLYYVESSTPAPPTLPRETSHTPDREFAARYSTGTPLPGTGACGTSHPSRHSLFNTGSRRESSCTPAARYSFPKPYVNTHTVDNNPLPPPPIPSPPIQYSFSHSNGLQQPAQFSSRVPKLPEFSGEDPDDCAFDLWRYEINCLIRNAVYPEHILLESIRKSLKGKARTVLLHLGEDASVQDILSELEGIYGNVSSGEKLKEKFYCAQQLPAESIADYSLRLEQLLSKSNIRFEQSTKNEMLCNRLWSGLYDQHLRSVSRYKFESIHDYGVLRKELRQMEQDLELNKKSPSSLTLPVSKAKSSHVQSPEGKKTPDVKVEPASLLMSSVENKILQQLQDLTNQMKQLNSRVGTVEKELQGLKKSRNYQGGYQDRSRWSDKSKEQGPAKETPKANDKSVADKVPENPLNRK
ncbi:uncharacterized protein LOC132742926 [Ruditapes philippinarum]|uniref:uncharacterized protein LOC132742926 n=1 Tax=Ruditapes philippinarum TaxID=129788 RepID=UPI00295AD88F|nr:uncharacterized protein LOC132742926 [Ruditapes philippinarum]